MTDAAEPTAATGAAEPPSATGAAEPPAVTRPTLARAGVFALLGAGALLAWAGSAQPWWRAFGGASSVELTGRQVSAGLTHALAMVTAAGLLLVLVLRTPGRRVLALLLALVGTGMVGAAAYRFRPGDEAVADRLRAVGLVDQVRLRGTGWPWLYGVSGFLVAAGAILLLFTAARWPSRLDRFARNRSTPDARTDLGDDALLAWRALDAGKDPTLAPPADRTTPDVHSRSARDTMGET